MKLGIYLNGQHPETDDAGRRLAELIEQVRLAASLGFDSIWGGEHHVTPGFLYFPLLPLLTRLAADAGEMALGTNLVLLPLHHPLHVAEQGALIDIACGGRFTLGVGLGYRQEEFDAYGVSMNQRVGRAIEGIEIIRRLWSEPTVTHSGRYFRLTDVGIRPRPLQQPRPPILLGGQVPPAIERAARLADGWLAVPQPTTAELAEHMAIFRQARSEAGLPPTDGLTRLMEVSCAADEETAVSRAAPYLLEKYAAYASWGMGMPGGASDNADPLATFRALAVDRFVVGDADAVVEGLLAQHRAGVTHATMRLQWPGMPQDDVLDCIERLGRDVLPRVRQRTAAA